jgi:hypothetical protein
MSTHRRGRRLPRDHLRHRVGARLQGRDRQDLSDQAFQPRRPRPARVHCAAADVFFYKRRLDLVAVVEKAALVIRVEKIGVLDPHMFGEGAGGVVASHAPVLPLPDMGHLMGEEHRGGEAAAALARGDVIGEVVFGANMQRVEQNDPCRARLECRAVGRRPDAFAAGRLGPRGIAAAAQPDDRVPGDADRARVEASALQVGHVGGLALGQGAAAGGERKKQGEGEEGAHGPNHGGIPANGKGG